jgi:hypothetical protein
MHRIASPGTTESRLSIFSMALLPVLALVLSSHRGTDYGWQVWVALIALLPTIYLGSFVHEMGHALFGWWMGYQVVSLGMGVGGPLISWRWGGTRFYLALGRPMQGITFAIHPRLLPPIGAKLVYLAGGPIFQGIFALMLAGAAWFIPPGRVVLLLLGVVNGVSALINFIPMRVVIGTFTMRSDGRLMLDTLRHGNIDMPLRDSVHAIEGLRGLWTRVGVPLLLRCSLLDQAIKWLEVDAEQAARQNWEESESLPPEPWPCIQAYSSLVYGRIAAASGSPEEAQQAIAQAEEVFAAADHEEGLFLTELARADIQARLGDVHAAGARLAELAEHPVATRRPALRASVRIGQLTMQARSPASDLQALEAEATTILRRHTGLAIKRQFYHVLAHAATAGGDAFRARRAYHEALSAAERIHEGWTHEPTRLAFVASQAPLVAEARAFFEQQGLTEEAEKLKELFPLPKEVRRRQREAAERRTRRQHRLLRWSALASLVPPLLAWCATTLDPSLERHVAFPALMLAACSVLSLLVSFAIQLLGYLFSELRRTFGWYPWLFLLGGWAVAVVGCFFPL